MSLSEEESFFLRFYYLNLKVATKAVRVYFNSVHPPAGLANELANSSATLKGLRFITSPQMLTLYPSPASNVRSDDFDTTLIVCLLRNMAPSESTPITGWDNLPHPGDTSTGADLARVKWYRNILAHHDDGKLTPTEFSMGWGELECAIGRLGGPSLLREAQSAQHIVLDKSLIDILNSLHDLQMSKVEHTSILHNLQSAINNQTTIKEEQEIKIQQLNDSLLEGKVGAQKLATDFTDIQRTIQICTSKIETCRRETDQIESKIQVMQGKWMKTEEKLDVLTQQLLSIECKYDIKFEEIDVRLAEQDEQMAKQGAQMKKQDERITQQDQLMAACVKDIDNMKITQSDTDYSSDGRKRKRLEDDTKALIEEDIREDTFVVIKAVEDGLLHLRQNGVLVITGYAGTGKSRIGRHVLHMYCNDNMSYNCIKLNTLDEWEDMVSREDNVVVLLDDIFGETNCIYNREKDTKILDKVHAYVSKGNIKVIITIRDTVKRQCREVFENHRLFKFDFIDLSIDKYILHWEEKDRILKKYMKTVRHSDYVEGAGFVDCNGVTILNPDEAFNIISENPVKGFPLAIYQFVYNAKFFQLGSKFFDRPTEAMLEEMNKIRRKGEDHSKSMIQYAVMVYTAINGNYIIPDDVLDREEVEKIIGAIYEKSIRLKQCHISDAITELKGSYLVNKPRENSYKFHHPTLLESVILSFIQIDEENIDKIIPSLSWSFILKMVKSDAYVEKDGEVVLKIPRNREKLLAYRLVDIYLSKCRESRNEVYWFLAEVIDTEIFQQKAYILLTYLLQAFEDIKHEHLKSCLKSIKYLPKSMFHEVDSCDDHMISTTVFLSNLLVSIAKTENQIKMYNFIVKNCKAIVETSNNYFTTIYMKSALITSLYEVCLTKDTSCVKATLHLIKEKKITVLLDQGVSLTILGLIPSYSLTSGFNYYGNQCVFLIFCIWKAYEAFHEPVLEYLLSLYNKIPFDVNLFLKTFYSTERLKGLTYLSYTPLKWMMERFEVDTDYILKAACQCHLFDIVENLSFRCETFDVISCLKIFLHEDIWNIGFDKDLFNFLFSKVDITSPEMTSIVVAVLQKQYVPDYVCESFLPVCINNEAILHLACKEAHIYITKLILENSRHVNIQSALISVCMEKMTTDYMSDRSQDEVEKLKIVKFIIGKYGYEQFDLKVVCQQACQNRKFKILKWLVLKIDFYLLDLQCIINSALVRERTEILECIIHKTDLTSLDKINVLKSIIWDSTDDKEALKIEKISDMAYEKKCFELLIWIHENCNLHVSIDAKQILILACKDGRTDVAKWILHSFEKTSLDINEVKLFEQACDAMSNYKYGFGKMSMVKWVIDTFQIKPFNLKKGVMKLLNHNEYQMWKYGDDFMKLIVSIVRKCSNVLTTEDTEEIVSKCITHKQYDIVNWFLENHKCCLLKKQNILNEACKDAQIGTIDLLNEYFHVLDMSEAIIYSLSEYEHNTFVCEYLLGKIGRDSLDVSRIVSTVCEKHVSDNTMKWFLLKFSDDQNTINKVFIFCCRQGKFNLLKYIFLIVPNEQLDILTAFYAACLHPNEWTLNSRGSLCVVDFLFQKLQDKSYNSSDVRNGLLANKRYDIILYFLEQGYCMIIDKSNLLIKACIHGYVKLVQWILQNVDHKELDFKAAFHEACTNCEDLKQLHCLYVMWHYIQDINLFEVDTVLKSMTEAPPCMSHVRAYVQDDLRKWLLYIKNINQTNDV